MTTIKRLQGWPRRYPWRAIGRARAREEYRLYLEDWPQMVFGAPARLGRFTT